jgi:hypothetical protein
MAVAAALMALREEMRGRERSLWAVLLIVLAFIEIKAIKKDNASREEAQQHALAEERQHFSDIGDGIRDAIHTSQQQFQSTINDNQKKFDATMGRTRQILKSTEKAADTANHAVEAVTGGASYPLVGISYNPRDLSHIGLYGLFVKKPDVGSFRYEVSEMESTHARPFEPQGVCFPPYFSPRGSTQSGDSGAIYQGVVQLWNVDLTPAKAGVTHFRVNMTTNTGGQFVQCLDVRPSPCTKELQWETRVVIWRADGIVERSDEWPKCR